MYAISGKASISAGAGAADAIIKIGLYFIHERIWAHIPFGRSKSPEYEI